VVILIKYFLSIDYMELMNDVKCLHTLLRNDAIFLFTLYNLFSQKEVKKFNERIEECDGNSELEQNCMNKVTKTIVKKLRKDKCTEILYDLLVFMFDKTHKAESSDDSSDDSSDSDWVSESQSESSDSDSDAEGTDELDTYTCAPPNHEENDSDSEQECEVWCNDQVFIEFRNEHSSEEFRDLKKHSKRVIDTYDSKIEPYVERIESIFNKV
jgi:hypothetical protein